VSKAGSEAAFARPVSKLEGNYGRPVVHAAQEGLTKRDLIAAMVLQGTLSNPNDRRTPVEAAAKAVEYADALIAELAK